MAFGVPGIERGQSMPRTLKLGELVGSQALIQAHLAHGRA